MVHIETLPLLAIIALGAWHGINPGMGWLFAVALGLQDRRGLAVWRALPPLALGHALAVLQTIAVGLVLGVVVPVATLKWVVGGVLVAVGLHKLARSRHPRYGGMRVGMAGLTVWSMLMAAAHGAGLMVLPFVLGQGVGAPGHSHHGRLLTAGAGSVSAAGIVATLLHTAAYLLVTACVALLVYHRLGLRLLRSAWVNLDLIWAGALLVTGVLTPLV